MLATQRLTELLLQGLPTTYNKDLQESVEPLLDFTKTVGDSIQIATGIISTLETQPQKMQAALAPEMLATELADYLCRRGVPFREGHHISGRAVAEAEAKGVALDQLSTEELRSVDGRFEDDVKECFEYERAVELKDSVGGTSRSSVKVQIRRLLEIVDGEAR